MTIISCIDTNNNMGSIKTIDLGKFSFTIPVNSKIENLKSIDTHAGKITIDSFVIYFDYGYSAASTNAVKTELEFIEKKQWVPDAVALIMPKNHIYTSDTIRKIVKIVNIDYKSKTATILFNGNKFFYKILIPDHLKGVVEKKDTLNGLVQRLIYNENLYKGKYYYEFQNIKPDSSENLNRNILVFKTEINNKADTLLIFNIFKSTKFR